MKKAFLSYLVLLFLIFTVCSCATQRGGQTITAKEKAELQKLTFLPVLCTVTKMIDISQGKYPPTSTEVLMLAEIAAPQCTHKYSDTRNYLEEKGFNSYFIEAYVESAKETLTQDAAYNYVKMALDAKK